MLHLLKIVHKYYQWKKISQYHQSLKKGLPLTGRVLQKSLHQLNMHSWHVLLTICIRQSNPTVQTMDAPGKPAQMCKNKKKNANACVKLLSNNRKTKKNTVLISTLYLNLIRRRLSWVLSEKLYLSMRSVDSSLKLHASRLKSNNVKKCFSSVKKE